jgi:hypothetical protein
MNARHAYALMRVGFEDACAMEKEWEIVSRGDATDRQSIERFLRSNFSTETILVSVSRQIGGALSISDAVEVVSSAFERAGVKIANRSFTEKAVIATAGVGKAWKVKSEVNHAS